MRWGRRRSDVHVEQSPAYDLVHHRKHATALPAPTDMTMADAVAQVVGPMPTEIDPAAPELVGIPDEPIPPTEIIDPLLRLGLSIVIGLAVSFGHIRGVVEGTHSLAMASWRFGAMTAVAWAGLWCVWMVWLSYRSSVDEADRALRDAAIAAYWVRVEAEHNEAIRQETQRQEDQLRAELERQEELQLQQRLEAERIEQAEQAERAATLQRQQAAAATQRQRARAPRGLQAGGSQAGGVQADSERLAVERQSAVALALQSQLLDDSGSFDEARRVEAALASEREGRQPLARQAGLHPVSARAEMLVDLAGDHDDQSPEWMRTQQMQAAS
jgi:hypothetical protein